MGGRRKRRDGLFKGLPIGGRRAGEGEFRSLAGHDAENSSFWL